MLRRPPLVAAMLSGLAVALLTGGSSALAGREATLPRGDGGQVAVQVYGPGNGCDKTMIVSHGLGGSSTGLSGLAEAMAAAGWRVIVMGHAESGPQVLRRAMFSGNLRQSLITSATDPGRHRDRFLDLDATYREATRTCRPRHLWLAGHSMGAMTTMLEAGAVARFGTFGSDRFDAYVALSPQGVGEVYRDGAWVKVKKPVLMVTGTRDGGFDGDYTPRLSAFRQLPPSGRHRLAIIDGATHMYLSGGNERDGRLLARLILDFEAGRPSRLPGVATEDSR